MALYVVLLPAVVFVSCVLWKHKDPPGVAYIAFVTAVGTLLLVIVVDSRWYEKIPALMAGGQTYAILENLTGRVERIETGVEKIQTRLSIGLEEHGHGEESVVIRAITPAAPTPTASTGKPQ